jgi:hypothetical protein
VSRYGALSLVPDGDGYVLGSRYSRDFVAVPAIGGEVVRWLQAGYSADECTRRAEERMGEPVDVAGFLAGLASAGLLPDATEEAVPAPPAWTVHIGRILFGPAGLTAQAALALTAAAVMVAVPRLRPAYTDVIVSGVPLVSLVVVALVARNLWGTKGAVARRAIGRASAADRALLATVDRKEVRWARVYLFLYVPGVLWTAWYFTVFAVPALRRLVAMSLDAVAAHGALHPLGLAGLLAVAVTLASTGFVLWGVARTAVRLVRQVMVVRQVV